MRALIRPLLILVALIVVPLPAWSVILKTKDGKEYKAHLVKSDAIKVTVRLHGSNEEKTFFRFDIENIVQTVEPKELEKLKPDDPKVYYNYALGLMAHQVDPEAVDTALRLFQIAAYLEPVQLGQPALTKMAELARSAEEAEVFRAMAYLLDVVADKSLLKKAAADSGGNDKARVAFIKGLELLRRGKTREALKQLEAKGAADHFATVPGFMSYEDFVRLCKEHAECNCTEGRVFCPRCVGKGGLPSVQGPVLCPDCKGKGFHLCKECNGKKTRMKLTPLQTQIILKLELLHETDPSAPLNSSGDLKTPRWSALLSGAQIRPVPVLNLLHLTEFDPRKSVYKNGQWVEP
jgi:hypothetical protein